MSGTHETLEDYIDLLSGSFDQMREISSGGGGIIIRAHHKGLDKEVIIKKVIKSKVNSLGKTGERDVLKNLKHPYLPQIYDYFEYGDDVFTVMELIPGKNFYELLQENRRFKTNDLVKWTNQLCEVVNYLHTRQPAIIHCDIKPGNIMLTPEGNICLIDFNISNVKGGEELTAIGYTPGYAPAEQFFLSELRKTQKPKKIQNVSNYSEYDERTQVDDLGDDEATQIDFYGEATQIDDESLYGETTQVDGESGFGDVAQVDHIPDSSAFPKESGKTGKKGEKSAKNKVWTRDEVFALIQSKKISGKIDERTDIYSIGATLYHIATGVKPEAFYVENRPYVQELNPSIPDGLAYIIQKSMSLKPEDRFADCESILKIASQVHRLDKRYKRIGRIETILIIMCGFIIASGILVSQRGLRVIQDENTAKYNALVEEMSNLRESGNYEDAEVLFESAVELNADRGDAYYEKGLSLFQEKRFEDCINFIKDDVLSNATVKGMDTNGSFYYLIANCYFEIEDYLLSADYYSKAIDIYSKNASYYRDYVISLARNGNISEAENALVRAESAGVTEDTLMLLEGEIYYAESKYSDATESLIECIDSSKDEEVLLRAYAKLDDVLAQSNSGNQQYEIRIEYLEKSLSTLSSENKIILMERLAQVYMDCANATNNDEYDKKALDMFSRIRNAGYGTMQTDYNIAVLYEKLGQYDDAISWLMKMIDDRGENYRWYKRLSFVELQRQDLAENTKRNYEQFKIYYDKAVELYKDNSSGNDSEMLVLDSLYQDLIDLGWL